MCIEIKLSTLFSAVSLNETPFSPALVRVNLIRIRLRFAASFDQLFNNDIFEPFRTWKKRNLQKCASRDTYHKKIVKFVTRL